jgi:hypothetical protein
MKIKRTLLVLTDSGRFKAYRMEESPRYKTPRLKLLEQWDTPVTRRISDQVTDKSGQFAKGSLSFSAINDMADGERHNLDLERRRRALKQMAARVGELLKRERLEICYLASSKMINQTVLSALADQVRVRIQKNVTANLTRLNPATIFQHFCDSPLKRHSVSHPKAS